MTGNPGWADLDRVRQSAAGTKRKTPAGAGAFYKMCPPRLRGDDPEALALRPSHASGSVVAISLARPLHREPGVRLGARWTDYRPVMRMSQVPRSSDFQTSQFTAFSSKL